MDVEGYTTKQGYHADGEYSRVVGGVWIIKTPVIKPAQ